MSAPRPTLPLLVVLLLAGGCRDHGSPEAPRPVAANLGLATQLVFGEGELYVVPVSEAAQGEDLNGDGDLLDLVAWVVDLADGSPSPTGLAFDPGATLVPLSNAPVLSVSPERIAFGVPEPGQGAEDRNGDGDALDMVAALWERATGEVTSVGLAVRELSLSEHRLIAEVPENQQGGQDLDGDGDVGGTVPFLVDLVRGRTINTRFRGRTFMAAVGDQVALAADEADLGDLTGDEDILDIVFEVLDLSNFDFVSTTRSVDTLQRLPSAPFVHHGLWGFTTDEREQGFDVDGDGDQLDVVTSILDPVARRVINLGQVDLVFPLPELDVLALAESERVRGEDLNGDGDTNDSVVGLYDPRSGQRLSTGLAGAAVAAVGARVAVLVHEPSQGLDLDRSGELRGTVVHLHDVATGETTNLGLSAVRVTATETGFLIFSDERVALRDWNGDGDRQDIVLWLWDDGARRLLETRIAVRDAVPLGPGRVLVQVAESDDGRDWNGDGDLEDQVLQVHDRAHGRVELGLEGRLTSASSGGLALVLAREGGASGDLNGDGDTEDEVLHLVGPGVR